MPSLLACLLALACLSFPGLGLTQSLVQTGRYTAVSTGPTVAQREPLQAVVTVTFPPDVTTIGGAVRALLADTGYALTDVLYWDPEVFQLHERPLPGVQRSLGPMTVFDALKTLAGPAFRVVVDPIHRLVSFEVDPTARTLHRDAVPELEHR